MIVEILNLKIEKKILNSYQEFLKRFKPGKITLQLKLDIKI